MKRRSRMLAECTYLEVEERLSRDARVFVPLGSTEQHGPHAPMGTDTILASEVASRLADQVGGLVAPALPYGYSLDHRGFPGVAWLSAETLSRAVGDIALSLAEGGFRRIVFVNGHFTNLVALSSAIAAVSDRLGPDRIAYSFSYWDALPPEELDEYLSLRVGLHANIGETSAVLAVDPTLVDMDAAAPEWPDFPVEPTGALSWAYFFSAFGTMHHATRSGVWGDPRGSTAAQGALFLDQITAACSSFIAAVEATFVHFGHADEGGS